MNRNLNREALLEMDCGMQKKSRRYKWVMALLLCCCMFGMLDITGRADMVYQNPQSGYKVAVDDVLDLITEAEEAEMIEIMQEISAYGNVAFLSFNGGENSDQTAELAEYYYSVLFGDTSGTVFFIDMQSRYLYIYSHNEMYEVITRGYAETITDNVYKEVKKGNYGACAVKAYSQMLSLLRGQKISQPMKYVSNTLLGIAISFLISFAWILLWCKKNMPKAEDKLQAVDGNIMFLNTYVTNKRSEKKYYPQGNPERASNSGGGHGGGGSGGGSGGSGGSGGGGGHSF